MGNKQKSVHKSKERKHALTQGGYAICSPEIQFQQQGDFFFSILDSLDLIIVVVDVSTHRILYANTYAKKLFGAVENGTCWKTLRSGMSGPCPTCVRIPRKGAGRTARADMGCEVEYTSSGKRYAVHEQDVASPDGRKLRLHFLTDITFRKRRGSDFSGSGEKYRTIADYTYDWECWVNEKRQFEYVSPSCERITGYRAEEFVNDPDLFYNIIHPEDKVDFMRHRKDLFTADQYGNLDFRIIRKTGEERWISHYCQPVYNRNGDFRGRRSSNRDITERKEAETRTKLNEQRLRVLVQLYEKKELLVKEICDFVLDSSLPLTSSSIGFMGFMNEDESIMTIHAWSKTVMQECAIHQKPMVFTVSDAGMWDEAVRQRRPVIINDFSLPSFLKRGTPKGHVEITRFMAVPLLVENRVAAVLAVGNKGSAYNKDDVGQVNLLLEGMWQIIRRKKAEDEVFRQSAKIRHFANAVAHDLKSPALAVHGFARMLREKYGNVLDGKGQLYCDQIIRNAEQISLLAEDINTYISTRENTSDFETLQLQELWDSVKQEFSLQLQKRKVSWLEQQVEPVELKCNRTGLLRIFRNLVENAFKYGGDKLTAIALGYEQSQTHHILRVENDGEMILPEDGEIIFEEFARKAGNSHVWGTGLGLAIVMQIAQKHKGTSWLESNEQGKPVFCISLSRSL